MSRRSDLDCYAPIDRVSDDGGDLLSMLWRRRALMVLMLLAGALAGLAAYRLQARMYESNASLEVEPPNDNFLNMGTVSPTSVSANYPADAYMLTQTQVLHSRPLLSRVADKIGLDARLGFQKREQTLRFLSENLKVEAPQGTRSINLRFRSTDPVLAADIVNTLTEQYAENSLDTRWEGTQRTAKWLNGRLQELKAGLAKSEAELQDYSRKSGLLFTADKDNVAEQRLRQIQEELSRAQADAMQRQARAELLTRTPPEALAELVESDTLRSYSTKLAELRQQRAELSTLLTPANYKVKRVENQIAELQAMIDHERANALNRIRADYDSARRREQLLTREFQSQTARVSDLAGRAIRYNLLKREVESSRNLYESLLQKVKEAGVASAIRASNVRVIDPAIPASEPYRPRLWIDLSAGLAAGLCFAGGLAFVLERSNRTLRTPGETASYLLTPELGAIPRDTAAVEGSGAEGTILGAARNALSLQARQNSDSGLELATWHSKQSLFSESYRQVLTSILSRSNEAPLKVIVVTSPNPAEGKTTAGCNLAIALARMDKRVLLVDADLRNPRLHEVFDLPLGPGLADLPQRRERPTALCRATKIPKLSVLTAGSANSNGPDVISPGYMPQILKELRADFDTVLLDTPPLLLLADARLLGRMADAAVLVVRSGKTDRESALRAVQRLEYDGTPLLGTVLTDWQPDRSTLSHYYKSYSGRTS